MRPKERIPVFIKHINIRELIVKWFANEKNANFSITKAIKEITANLLSIITYWSDNPHLRFSQVLISLDYIPNKSGMWYYEEEHNILIEQGCKPRDVILWGRNFNKEGNRLPKTEWILIKDLSTNHIENILTTQFLRIGPTTVKYFADELELRKKTKSK